MFSLFLVVIKSSGRSEDSYLGLGDFFRKVIICVRA